jgi:hypothetical protein
MVASYQQLGLVHAIAGCGLMMTMVTAPTDRTKARAANAMRFFFMEISRTYGTRALISDATRWIGSRNDVRFEHS